MYTLLVSNECDEHPQGNLKIPQDRFLEYTSESVATQLRNLSKEAIDCIRSWPCLIMKEGRGEEQAQIGQVTDVSHENLAVKVFIKPPPIPTLVRNRELWTIRGDLDIEQFEFHRLHFAVKDRDLFGIFNASGNQVDSTVVGAFTQKPLPAPRRSDLLAARNIISEWSHKEIDDLLLAAGVKGLAAGRELGSRHNRANTIVKFAFDNPCATTAENSLFSASIVEATGQRSRQDESVPADTFPSSPRDNGADYRSPNRVFIVHGQNEAAKVAVASFLKSVGLAGIVLHEQPNMGRHLLTKFIDEAELVTFAVVLMTDDDVGALKGREPKPRARQNVILELGYFLAHLGQKRVCALITPDLETPSDFDGIAYIRMDEGSGWQTELTRELRAAGMPLSSTPSRARA